MCSELVSVHRYSLLALMTCCIPCHEEPHLVHANISGCGVTAETVNQVSFDSFLFIIKLLCIWVLIRINVSKPHLTKVVLREIYTHTRTHTHTYIYMEQNITTKNITALHGLMARCPGQMKAAVQLSSVILPSVKTFYAVCCTNGNVGTCI